MNFRALTAALFVSTLLLSACGSSRVPTANQPVGGNWVGGGYTAPGAGNQPVQPVQPVGTQPGFQQPSNGDYYSWYCAYDPAGCYGEYYQDYTGCGGNCGNDWYADFYFGSQVAGR